MHTWRLRILRNLIRDFLTGVSALLPVATEDIELSTRARISELWTTSADTYLVLLFFSFNYVFWNFRCAWTIRIRCFFSNPFINTLLCWCNYLCNSIFRLFIIKKSTSVIRHPPETRCLPRPRITWRDLVNILALEIITGRILTDCGIYSPIAIKVEISGCIIAILLLSQLAAWWCLLTLRV